MKGTFLLRRMSAPAIFHFSSPQYCQANIKLFSRFISSLRDIGFFRESEVYVSQEHAVIMKIKRSFWVAPYT